MAKAPKKPVKAVKKDDKKKGKLPFKPFEKKK